jgi:hypothetical protein
VVFLSLYRHITGHYSTVGHDHHIFHPRPSQFSRENPRLAQYLYSGRSGASRILRTSELSVYILVYICIYLFTHLVVCLTTGPKPLPKRALHIVRSRASSFKREYPLLSLSSSSSFLRLLLRLPVTSIPPFIFPSITCRRRQFLRKM